MVLRPELEVGHSLSIPVTDPITIFLIDRHTVVREGLAAVLSREPDFSIAGQSKTVEEAIAEISAKNPHVVIMDYRFPALDGVWLCRALAEGRLRSQVVMLSYHLDDRSVYSAFLAGARAYIIKDVAVEELKRAIRAAAQMKSLVDPKVTKRVISLATQFDPVIKQARLRPGQLRVLQMLIDGLSNAEIARRTNLSQHTVKTYVHEIYVNLGVSSRAEATAVALRRGFVSM